MAAQRYTDPVALARMADGKCPECGEPGNDHTGWGLGRCMLTDNGVAQRLAQYLDDEAAAKVGAAGEVASERAERRAQ